MGKTRRYSEERENNRQGIREEKEQAYCMDCKEFMDMTEDMLCPKCKGWLIIGD
jgi:Zn finger protein HypA/HybF involved in hydrogenase expression